MPGVDEFLARLEGVKGASGGWIARCPVPAHDDHRQSLSVAVGRSGGILLKCHKGCELGDIVAALGMSVEDLFPEDERGNGKGREIVAVYEYTDEAGVPLFQKVRLTGKEFRQRRRVAGEWLWKLGDTRRVLYQLPKVLAAVAAGQRVFVVEGEKDVHAIAAAGGVATCNPEGASASASSPKWRPEYSECLRGANVVVVQDKDDPGRNHARQIVESLDGVAASVQLVEAATGKDAHDHIAAGGSLDDFVQVTDVPAGTSSAKRSSFIDWTTFWKDTEQPQWLYKDVLALGRGHAIYAIHKGGKSLFALFMAAKLATEQSCCCLYVDYEMTEDDLRERLLDMGYGPESDLSRLKYALLPTLPALDTEAGGEALMDLLGEALEEHPGCPPVVVIDTISRAVLGEENSADTWRLFYVHTGLRLKQRGVTWLRLDHGGKDAEKGQRGSSGKGDDVDVVWKLTRTENGIMLKRELSRMAWVPETVTMLMDSFPLRYMRAARDWPSRTAEIANLMDRLSLPIDVTFREAGKRVREVGDACANELIKAALEWRRERAADAPQNSSRSTARSTAEHRSTHPPTAGGSTAEHLPFSLRSTARSTAEHRSDHREGEDPPLLRGSAPVVGGADSCRAADATDRFAVDMGDDLP